MGFIIRGFIWEIPSLVLAYVPVLGPDTRSHDGVTSDGAVGTSFIPKLSKPTENTKPQAPGP